MTARIGLALSGGGSRAAAFHLGCLRALHDYDLLGRVRVVSGISGGALLAASWAYGPAEFGDFDQAATDLLRRGLERDLAWRVLNPAGLARSAASTAMRLVPSGGAGRAVSWNRTEAFARLLDQTVFPGAHIDRPEHGGLDVVLTATDLSTGAAVRFGSQNSSCSRYGKITDSVSVGTAVAASAAYPVLLPTLNRDFSFQPRNGPPRTEAVALSDGGIFDNLGLSVLQPNRSSAHTDHIYNVTHVISCDAGRGPLAGRAPSHWVARNARAFQVVHAQAQNHGRGRLHEWRAANSIQGFAMAYLGQNDSRLPRPLADLVPVDKTARYPTNFAAMPSDAFAAIATRGEQLIRLLLPYYCPELLS